MVWVLVYNTITGTILNCERIQYKRIELIGLNLGEAILITGDPVNDAVFKVRNNKLVKRNK